MVGQCIQFPGPSQPPCVETSDSPEGNAAVAGPPRAILGPVFELILTSSFSAAHALVIQGVREPVHGHDWQVEATFSGNELDEDGMLCDFHALEQRLEAIIAPFRTADLNAAEAFKDLNPSAELVARHIGMSLQEGLPQGVCLDRLSVTEAPGCKAVWVARSGMSMRS